MQDGVDSQPGDEEGYCLQAHHDGQGFHDFIHGFLTAKPCVEFMVADWIGDSPADGVCGQELPLRKWKQCDFSGGGYEHEQEINAGVVRGAAGEHGAFFGAAVHHVSAATGAFFRAALFLLDFAAFTFLQACDLAVGTFRMRWCWGWHGVIIPRFFRGVMRKTAICRKKKKKVAKKC